MILGPRSGPDVDRGRRPAEHDGDAVHVNHAVQLERVLVARVVQPGGDLVVRCLGQFELDVGVGLSDWHVISSGTRQTYDE